MKHALRFPDVYQNCDAQGRGQQPVEQTHPRQNGRFTQRCLVQAPGSFRRGTEVFGVEGHPGPVHPLRSAPSPRTSRPKLRGFGRNSRASASPQTQGRHRSGGSFQRTPTSAGDS
ncbi:unnamed protein product [Coccothraustes coccothraustes]